MSLVMLLNSQFDLLNLAAGNDKHSFSFFCAPKLQMIPLKKYRIAHLQDIF
jgi:hypothetical protein